MARAKARIIVTRLARGRQRPRRSSSLLANFIAAAALFLALCWVVKAPSLEGRRDTADFVGAATALRTPQSPTEKSAGRGARPAKSVPTKLDHAPAADGGNRPVPPPFPPSAGARTVNPEPIAALAQARNIRETARLAQAEIALRVALEDLPSPSRGLVVTEQRQEGLRIRILDRPDLFVRGEGIPSDHAQLLLAAIAKTAAALPNRITICANTDEPGGAGLSLAQARADATRRLLQSKGVAGERFQEVAARAGDGGLAVTLLRDESASASAGQETASLSRSAPKQPRSFEPWAGAVGDPGVLASGDRP